MTDTTLPVLDSISVSDTDIDRTAGENSVTVSLAASDEGSGVASITVVLLDPDGGTYTKTLNAASGSVTFSITDSMPEGDYSFESVTVTDNEGNERVYDGPNLSSLFENKLTINDGVEDTTPPEIVTFEILDPQVDGASGDNSVTLQIALSDDFSGVYRFYVQIYDDDGLYIGIFKQVMNEESAQLTFTFPEYFASGTYHFRLVAYDNADNSIGMDGGALLAAGFNPYFTITGLDVADVTPPTVINLSIYDPVVDMTAGDQEITINLVVDDDLSGLSRGVLFVVSPSGQYLIKNFKTTDGTYTFTVPDYFSNGEYSVKVYLKDNALNDTWYYQQQLSELGHDATFTVTGATPDVIPPVPSVFTITDVIRDQETGDTQVTIDVELTETHSGMAYMIVSVRSPTKQLVQEAIYKSDTGTFSLTIPEEFVDGDYQITLTVRDYAANEYTYSHEELSEMGFDVSFTVTDSAEPEPDPEPEPEPEPDPVPDPDPDPAPEPDDGTDNAGHGNNTDGQDDDNPSDGGGGPNETEADGEDEDEIIKGGTGNDVITSGSGNDTLSGGAGNDTVNAGDGDDVVWAGADDEGDDVYIGGSGNDTMGGGPGNDLLIGDHADGSSEGAGGDLLFGGNGNDTLVSGSWDDLNGDGVFQVDEAVQSEGGNDVVWAGNGNDLIISAAGDDALGGGAGDDEISAGDGNDTVYGGAGDGDGEGINDVLSGENGDDLIFSGVGNDVVSGGNGNDTLYSGQGDDTVNGGSGADILYMGAGDDLFTGGDGADTFYFVNNGGHDTITDFDMANDSLDLSEIDGIEGAGDLADLARNATIEGEDGLLLDFGDNATIFLAGLDTGDLAGLSLIL